MPRSRQLLMITVARSTCRASGIALAVLFAGCVSEELAADIGENESAATDQAMQNAELVDVSGGIVELRTPLPDGNERSCTATMINENSLVTAAQCGEFHCSYFGNVKVIYQETATTWPCPHNTTSSGQVTPGVELWRWLALQG